MVKCIEGRATEIYKRGRGNGVEVQQGSPAKGRAHGREIIGENRTDRGLFLSGSLSCGRPDDPIGAQGERGCDHRE
eukprot:387395-Heterocapsa_arctica.AAC.1